MKFQNLKCPISRLIILFIIAISISGCKKQPLDLKSSLQVLSEIPLKTISPDSIYTESYELWYTQNIDHKNTKSDKFNQRVVVNHVGFDRPTVVILEGYGLYTTNAGELSTLLNANQVIIEHRFFNKSRPDSIPWKFLNIKQAAIDQHKIIQSLKNIYPEKWISTGISKGGQTTMYHRRFFPDDVNASVLYVAPLNFEREDSRIAMHLNSVGTKEDRDKILNFQFSLFDKKPEIISLYKRYAEEKGYTFNLVGFDRAYDLNVLEYSFAFWQWSGNCNKIPDVGSSVQEMFNHWKSTAPFSFFADQDLTSDRIFTYQALTEIGFYKYDISKFRKYLKDTVDITFDYKIPKGIKTSFDPAIMSDINDWIQKKGNYMLYIYGENDPWGATAVNPSENTISVKMINPNGNHSTRIKSFPDNMQDSIFTILENWTDAKIIRKNRSGGISGVMFEIL